MTNNDQTLTLLKMVMDAHWDADIDAIIGKVKRIKEELFSHKPDEESIPF